MFLNVITFLNLLIAKLGNVFNAY